MLWLIRLLLLCGIGLLLAVAIPSAIAVGAAVGLNGQGLLHPDSSSEFVEVDGHWIPARDFVLFAAFASATATLGAVGLGWLMWRSWAKSA